MTSGYLCRRLTPRRFEITRWSESKEPDAVYELDQVSSRVFTCNCPTRGQRRCKHHDIVVRFLAEEFTRDPYTMYEL